MKALNFSGIRLSGFAVAFLTGICLTAQVTYFPEKGEPWEEKPAGESGLNQSAIDRAVKFAIENEYSGSKDLRIAILKGFAHEPYHKIVGPTRKRGGATGMIIKNGFIVAKWGDPDRVDMTFSVTKSYLSTVAGLAVDNKLIQSVDDPVYQYVWDGTFDGAHNNKISWDHLLNQSSDWSGSLFGMYDWADRPPKEGGIDDWKNREHHPSGTHFKYNDVRVNVLSYALLQVWRKPLPSVLKTYIMDPIGASDTWRWFGYETSWVTIDGLKIQSVSGGGHSGGGMFVNSYDQARFGLLFVNDGKWNDKQLISSEWIDMATRPSDANPAYGYLWWLNSGDSSMEGVPNSIFYAAGFGGNYIVIDRENSLLIVTRWLEPSKLAEFLKLIYEQEK
jgi:CubicO group peptidase (beta-lactamase class C family)